MLVIGYIQISSVASMSQYGDMSTAGPTYSAFNWNDPYYDSTLSCSNCIQNNYIYCRKGTQEQVILTPTTAAPEETCCKNYFECPGLYSKDWICSTKFTDKMLALRMCPFKQSSCGTKNSAVFNKAGETLNFNMTLYPGDVCLFSVKAKCGIPSLEFETASNDWTTVDIYTIDYDD